MAVALDRDAGPRRWPFALIAALCTFGMIGSLAFENWKKQRALPTITYITSWPANRTEAETRAFIAENERRKEAEQAQQAASDAEGQKLWMAVGRASGIDVDKMKARADAEVRLHDRIVEVDERSLTVTAEAGVNGVVLERALNERGLTLPHYPASADLAFRRLGHEGIQIVNTEMVLFEWLERAGTPEFRELSALVK